MIIMGLSKTKSGDEIKGACANCNESVYESLFTLDDAYNVWAGKCPFCNAINLLSTDSLRGYCSSGIDLVLPFDEEIEPNGLPNDTPTQGKSGQPADMRGSQLGELLSKIRDNKGV